MRPRLLLAAVAACVLLHLCLSVALQPAHACTTIVVGRKATADGSLIVTHNNDCEDCDVRVGVIQAAKYKKDSKCPIHPCAFDFPRYVGEDRGPMYTPEHTALEGIPGWTPTVTQPLGHIPQVERTYAYYDGSYGMMNEMQLAIGESTCSAKIAAFSVARGGEALMEASVLTRIALERCATARCAVELIGRLSEEYGFAGSEDPPAEGEDLFDVAGEALTIVDTQEAWVMHLLADSTGRSAIWAAQRLADDHVSVVPNQFVIDRINVSDSDNFMASHDIVGAAVKAGLADAEEAEREGGADNFHFSRAFELDYIESTSGADGGEGERRRWRIFSVLAPGLGLQPDQQVRFPFSVRAEKPVTVQQIMSLMRDHYEGTPYDQTKGLAAGPYGNPNRFDRNPDQQPEVSKGWFERSVSIHRTSYSFVAQTRASERFEGKDSSTGKDGEEVGLGGILWLALHSPQNSVYLPLYSSSLAVPESFNRGSLYRLDRQSAWWAFATVSNQADRMYSHIHAYIAERQEKAEKDTFEKVEQVDKEALQLIQAGKRGEARELMTKFTVEHSQKIVADWWQLNDELTVVFRDGVRVRSKHPPLKQEHLFYPLPWLESVGYFSRGPITRPKYPVVPQRIHALPEGAADAQKEKEEGTDKESAPVRGKAKNKKTKGTQQLQKTADGADAQQEQQQQGGSSSTLVSPAASATVLVDNDDSWAWLRSESARTPVAIALFTLFVVVVALVCFQLGKFCAWRRRGYEALDGDEETSLGAGGAGYGSREGFSRTGPRVVLTTR